MAKKCLMSPNLVNGIKVSRILSYTCDKLSYDCEKYTFDTIPVLFLLTLKDGGGGIMGPPPNLYISKDLPTDLP